MLVKIIRCLEKFKKLIIEWILEISRKKLLPYFQQLFINLDINDYNYIKTILHPEPIYLYDIYQPLCISYNDKRYKTDSIKYLFDEISNFITILGDAGSGKSTLTKYLFLNAIEENVGKPVLIELRNIGNEKLDFREYIINKIQRKGLSHSKNLTEWLLKHGKIVFFFDGYDEVSSRNLCELTDQLNDFIYQYKKNKYILTSRCYSNAKMLDIFHPVYLLPLTKSEMISLVNKQVQDEKIAQDIIKSINQDTKKYISEFLANPLLLCLYILTFKTYPDIPSKRHQFYRRVIDVLFMQHDSLTKNSWVREKECNLDQDQYEKVLKMFSLLTLLDNEYIFSKDSLCRKLELIKNKIDSIYFDNNLFINDMKEKLCLWLEDGGYYQFLHRSIQTYFTTCYIKNLNGNKKQKMYTVILERIKQDKLLGFKNLITLCEDMDSNDFYKYLLIPFLESILDKYILDTKESVFRSYIKDVVGDVFIWNENGKFFVFNRYTGILPDRNKSRTFFKLLNKDLDIYSIDKGRVYRAMEEYSHYPRHILFTIFKYLSKSKDFINDCVSKGYAKNIVNVDLFKESLSFIDRKVKDNIFVLDFNEIDSPLLSKILYFENIADDIYLWINSVKENVDRYKIVIQHDKDQSDFIDLL